MKRIKIIGLFLLLSTIFLGCGSSEDSGKTPLIDKTAATEKSPSPSSETTKSVGGQPTSEKYPKVVHVQGIKYTGPMKFGESLVVGQVKWRVDQAEKLSTLWNGNQFQEPANPNGVFVRVTVTAEVVGAATVTLDQSMVGIVDTIPRTFSASSEFNVLMNTDQNQGLRYKQVNPNVPITAIIIYDVATDAQKLTLAIADVFPNMAEVGYFDLQLN